MGIFLEDDFEAATSRSEEPIDIGSVTCGWDWINMREYDDVMPEPLQITPRPRDDLEHGKAIFEMAKSMKGMDPEIVTWNGPNDPMNPKNWPRNQKWIATIVVSLLTFISPIASTIISPAIPDIARDLHITGVAHQELVLSIFVLSYGAGPLFWAPLSEIYGRTIVLQLANLFFLAFNLACGSCQTEGQIMAFRLLSGIGGSAPLAVSLLTYLYPVVILIIDRLGEPW